MMRQFIKIIDKIQRLNRLMSAGTEVVGILALLLIMAITCIDVISAKALLKPVPGALDMVMLAQTIAISFGVAATLSVGGHVSVEIFLMHMPPFLKRFTMVITEVLSLFLFVLVAWQLAVYGHELRLGGEISPTARIPIYPFAYGIALATVPACIELFTRIIRIAFGRDPA